MDLVYDEAVDQPLPVQFADDAHEAGRFDQLLRRKINDLMLHVANLVVQVAHLLVAHGVG